MLQAPNTIKYWDLLQSIDPDINPAIHKAIQVVRAFFKYSSDRPDQLEIGKDELI